MKHIAKCQNPLKRVKFISINCRSGRRCKMKFASSQSPQTGQVYFNFKGVPDGFPLDFLKSQSPQTGQVYFNKSNVIQVKHESKINSHNRAKRGKLISLGCR